VSQASKAKATRRAVRRAVGDDAAFFTLETYRVIWRRSFWGRLKWLVFGR
jgi:hypothetical protein